MKKVKSDEMRPVYNREDLGAGVRENILNHIKRGRTLYF